MTMSRLGAVQPTEVIDRSTSCASAGTASASAASRATPSPRRWPRRGEHVFSRSMKYHRPRGILTADYWDPNLMVQVGDDPNVRAGHRLLEAGMDVRPQNVWPSLHRDLKAANGLVGRFLTAGFYYKTFMRPAWLWPTYERVLSTFAPGGKVDPDTPHRYHDKRYMHPDVVVAGAGPAGIEAALAASAAGARVLLVEHEHAVGGHLRYSSRDSDRAALAELRAALDASDVEVLTDSTVTGRYEDNWLGIVQRNHPIAVERLIKARAKVLVAAPGLIERPYVFAGNDRPGVVTSGAARRLINLWGVKPGERAVVFTANSDGDDAAADLDRAGVEVAAVIDGREGQAGQLGPEARRKALEAVVAGGSRLEADLLVVAAGWTAPTSLLNMAGDRPVYDPAAARFFPSDPPGNVLAAGGLAGDGALDDLRAHGAATGRLAAQRAAAVAHRLQALTARSRPDGRRRAVLGARRAHTAGPRPPSRALPLGHSRNGRLLRGRRIQGPSGGGPGGLRLRGAGQALHHRHHGTLAGQARDGQHRGRHRRGPGRDHRPGRHHRVAAALRAAHAGRAGRAGVRAGAGVVDPSGGTRPTG